MVRILIAIFLFTSILSCKKEESNLSNPSSQSSVNCRPILETIENVSIPGSPISTIDSIEWIYQDDILVSKVYKEHGVSFDRIIEFTHTQRGLFEASIFYNPATSSYDTIEKVTYDIEDRPIKIANYNESKTVNSVQEFSYPRQDTFYWSYGSPTSIRRCSYDVRGNVNSLELIVDPIGGNNYRKDLIEYDDRKNPYWGKGNMLLNLERFLSMNNPIAFYSTQDSLHTIDSINSPIRKPEIEYNVYGYPTKIISNPGSNNYTITRLKYQCF